jgi:predicted RNA binding protein YcfA (HicA-like mRNA interferase family)
MPRLPRITGKELVKALQKEGFEITRQRGSHVQMTKRISVILILPQGRRRISVVRLTYATGQ